MDALQVHLAYCGGTGREVVRPRRLEDGQEFYLVFEPGRDKVSTRRLEAGAHDVNWLSLLTYGHLCQAGYDRGHRFARERHIRLSGSPPGRGNRYDFPPDAVPEFAAWNRAGGISLPPHR